MTVIAHLSDIHLDGEQRSANRATATMDYLNDLPHDLDAVLVTGDIADHGLASEYEQAREILKSRHPVFTCPGNHDVRTAFRQILLGEPAGDGPINQAHRTAAGLVALCDSSIPGEDEGRLSEETLAWLAGLLSDTASDVPVFIAFHHPPVVLHIPYIDAMRQFGEHRLAELVMEYPNVVAVLCGHAHTPAATMFAGRPLLVAPGVVSTLTLPWEQGVGREDIVDYRLPPAVAFHVLDEHGRLTTHYRVVPA